jgi:cell fate regulator YaaT (PSP1 superfamily)
VCAGLAEAEDLARDDENRRRRAEGRLAAKRLIREHQLPMKLTAVDYVSSANVFTVYFSAPHRVDFRALVRDLASRLRARVELRQIGPRDEARLQGGIGPCGRDLCCATFLKDFEPVSVRMAKDQDLPVNPMRIAGACGRLMCCLKYEHPLYTDFKKDAPRAGTHVDTPEGPGTVVGHNVPSDSVVVKLTADGRTCACSRASVCGSRKAYESMHGSQKQARPSG